MSGKVVSWAMEQHTGSPAAKLVLAKLADNANEQGFCWPSIELLIEHTELGQSTVYKHLTALEGLGLIKALDALHPEHGYAIKAFQIAVPEAWQEIPPRGKRKGAIPPGGKSIPPRGNKIPGGGKTIPPGGIPYKDEPSIEPPEEPKAQRPSGGSHSKPQAELDLGLPAWLPVDAWTGFVAMRNKIRYPLTDRAKTLIVSKLDELRKHGHDPGEVLDQSTRNSWRDVFKLKSDRGDHVQKPALTGFAATVGRAVQERNGNGLFDGGGEEIVISPRAPA